MRIGGLRARWNSHGWMYRLSDMALGVSSYKEIIGLEIYHKIDRIYIENEHLLSHIVSFGPVTSVKGFRVYPIRQCFR